jgi:hypothetical protein
LVRRPIVIDFDDHSLISFKTALQALRERSQRAKIFAIRGVEDGVPSLDGNPRADTKAWSVARMPWPQPESLTEDGWDIAAHTCTHSFLTELPEGPEGDARIMYEPMCGKEDIETNLGPAPTHFGYLNAL